MDISSWVLLASASPPSEFSPCTRNLATTDPASISAWTNCEGIAKCVKRGESDSVVRKRPLDCEAFSECNSLLFLTSEIRVVSI